MMQTMKQMGIKQMDAGQSSYVSNVQPTFSRMIHVKNNSFIDLAVFQIVTFPVSIYIKIIRLILSINHWKLTVAL